MKTIDKVSYMYEDAYAAKSFYRGTSFRINDWEPDTYYFHDDQYIDWVIINGAICVCMRSHISNEDNKPQLLYQNNIPVGISPNSCWSFVFGGVSSNNGSNNNQSTVVNKDLTRLRFQNNILEISNDEGETWNYVADFSNVNQPLDLSAEVVQVNNSDTTSSASVDLVDNTLKFSFTLQRGADGAPGNNGAPGADGADGKDGADGQDGEDGADGNGFDHIFYLTETPVLDSAHDPSKLAAVQDDNYYADEIGWSTYAMQVNETYEYQWMSTRKKVNGVWGTFSDPIILNTYASEGIVPEVSYTSFVFCRTNASFTNTDSVPTGGSYKNPFPSNGGTIGGKEVEWSDSVPQGTEMIWMSSVTFDNKTDYDTTTVSWSQPRRMSDTNEFQVEFTQEVPYKTPEPLQSYYNADPINYEENWRKNNSTWYDGFTDVDNDGTDDRPLAFSPVYMATASMHNGVWSDWTVVKVKGEDGDDGLPLNVIGSVPTYNDLPQCSEYKGNPGDAFVVEEYTNSKNVLEKNVLFVFSGDNKQCWIYLGPLSATGAYVHIKYADRLWPIDSEKKHEVDGHWIGFTRVSDETPGETPGDYIGIYSDNNENDSMNPADYKWSKWVGQDGWGYEYIYKGTNENSAPNVPSSNGEVNGKHPQDNDYVPLNWSDDPVSISETMKYCWMCYRVKQNNTWSDFKGSNESGGTKAALWAKWGEQGNPGEDGAGVEYIFALSAIETTNFSDSGLVSPNNDWAYDNPVSPWCDNPQQVSAEYPVQWVSERVKPQGAQDWGDWSNPTIWSSFGTLGMTSTIVKVWQRSQNQLTLNNIKNPENGAKYSLKNNTLTFSNNLANQNGWYYNEEVQGDGKYLYSLGAHVVTNKDSITINKDDWKLLTLESVNGENGSGQSAISMTVDPDSALINVDNDGNSIWDHTINGSANYYYGTSLIESTFSYEAVDGISVEKTDSSNKEHNFKITVNKGVPFTSSKQIKITLTPTNSAIDAGENGIDNLSALTKSIFLNPIKSNDVWSIWVNTDQIIDQSDNDQDWSATIEAEIMLNNKPYSGDNAKLYYILGSESPIEWQKENGKYSFIINQQNIGDVANAFTVILEVNGVNLIHQVVSIIRNGSNGDPGISTRTVFAYISTGEDPTSPPRPSDTEGSVDFTNNSIDFPGLWSDSQDLTGIVWMTQRTFFSEPSLNTTSWSKPIRITGEDGKPGTDGTMIEFAYHLCKDESEINSIGFPEGEVIYMPESGKDYYSWTDSPQGIDETYKIEVFSQRLKTNDTWGKWSKPSIWAKWGEDGMDGDGVEYIFKVVNNKTDIDSPVKNNEYYTKYFDIIQKDDFCPNREWLTNYTSQYPNIIEDLASGWTDQPSDVSSDEPYEYVSIRKKKNEVWQAFSKPVLWNEWHRDGYDTYTEFAFTSVAPNVDLEGCEVTGGTYDNPLPEDLTTTQNGKQLPIKWYETLPTYVDGNTIWMISATFSNNPTHVSNWSKPSKMIDSQTLQVEYSNTENIDSANMTQLQTILEDTNYTFTTLEDLEVEFRNREKNRNVNWGDENIESPIWMVTSKLVNGTWTKWTVSRIKGEKGDTGTSISGLYEYYTWNNKTEWDIQIDAADVTEINTGGTWTDPTTGVNWTCNKIPTTDGANPCLWNFELIKTTDGEVNIIQPALISSNGKGIQNIFEYYLITSNASASTPTVEELKSENSAWTESYDYRECDENNPYILNCEYIEYTDGTSHITSPEVVFAYSKGEDGQSILDIFEYYLYAPKDYTPEPDWDNYEITWNSGDVSASTLNEKNSSRVWSYEEIPSQIPDGCPVLWNVEVVVYADSGDGHTHTRPIPISDRGLEIQSIKEYYLVSKEVSGIIFNADTISNWKYVAPNEEVPVTGIDNPYLWNAELITYVDGSAEYRPASRIGVFIKGDKGDPGENANNLSLDFSDDMNTIRIDRDTKLSIEDESYENVITLHQGSSDITDWTADIIQWPSIFGTKPTLKIENGKATLSFTVSAGTKVENKQAIIIEGSAYIAEDDKTLTTRKTYNIMPIFESTRYNIISDISRQSCDYKGLINGKSEFTVHLAISGVADVIPKGYYLWLQDSRDLAPVNINKLNQTLSTIIDNTNIYWYKVYLCYGNKFSVQTIRDFTTIEIGWQQKPEVYFTLNTSELYGNINNAGQLSLLTTKLDYTFRVDGAEKSLNDYKVTMVPTNNEDYNFEVTVDTTKTLTLKMKSTPAKVPTSDFTLACIIKVSDSNGDYLADFPIWITFESNRYYAVIDNDDIRVNPRFMPATGTSVRKTTLYYSIYENNTKIANYCRVKINNDTIKQYFGILSSDHDALTITYNPENSVVQFLNTNNGIYDIGVTVFGYGSKSDYLSENNCIAEVNTSISVRLDSSENWKFYYLYNYEPLKSDVNQILFYIGDINTLISSKQLNGVGKPYTLKCSIDGGSIELATINTDNSTGNLSFDCTNVKNTLEFYLYKDNELVGYSKLFRNGYYEQLEADDEGKEEILQASTTVQQNDWLNHIPSVINNESAVDILLNPLPSRYEYVLDNSSKLTIDKNNILKIGADVIKSTHTIKVRYNDSGNLRVLASKTFEVEKPWYIECPDELNVYSRRTSSGDEYLINDYKYPFTLNTNGVAVSLSDNVHWSSESRSVYFDDQCKLTTFDICFAGTDQVIKTINLNWYDATEFMDTHSGSYYNNRSYDVYVGTSINYTWTDDIKDMYQLVPSRSSITLEPKTYYIYLPWDTEGNSKRIGEINYADKSAPISLGSDFTSGCGYLVPAADPRILKIDFNRSYTKLNVSSNVVYELCLPMLIGGNIENNLYNFTEDDMIGLIGKEFWLDISMPTAINSSSTVNYSKIIDGSFNCSQLTKSSILHIKYSLKYNDYLGANNLTTKKLDIYPEEIEIIEKYPKE